MSLLKNIRTGKYTGCLKQRKYMLLAMLAAAALTMTACSNKKADVDTAEAQESPDAYVTEEETGEGDGIYMYKPIAADAFTYDRRIWEIRPLL